MLGPHPIPEVYLSCSSLCNFHITTGCRTNNIIHKGLTRRGWFQQRCWWIIFALLYIFFSCHMFSVVSFSTHIYACACIHFYICITIKCQLFFTTGAQKLARIRENSNFFRSELQKMGFEVLGDNDSPVMPIMLYNPAKIPAFSRECLKQNVNPSSCSSQFYSFWWHLN